MCLTEDQRNYLLRRIHSLQSKLKRVGPIRQAGIYRTIEGMKKQLTENKWNPPFKE